MKDNEFWLRLEIFRSYNPFEKRNEDTEVRTTVRSNFFLSSVYQFFIKNIRNKKVVLVAKEKENGDFKPYETVELSKKFLIDRVVISHSVMSYHTELSDSVKSLNVGDVLNSKWQIEEFKKILDKNNLSVAPFFHGDYLLQLTVPNEIIGVCKLGLDIPIINQSDVIRYCLARYLSVTSYLNKPTIQKELKRECDKYLQSVQQMARSMKDDINQMISQPESCEALILSLLDEKGEIDVRSLDLFNISGNSPFTLDEIKATLFDLELEGSIIKEGNIIKRGE